MTDGTNDPRRLPRSYPDGAGLIADERDRQLDEKKYDAEEDDLLRDGELCAAAARIVRDVQQDRGDVADLRGLTLACAVNVKANTAPTTSGGSSSPGR